jgi:hypothetical protein
VDTLTFISNVIASIAWPASIVLAAFVLRGPIRELLKLLTKLRYGELEFNFERKVEKLEIQAGEAIPASDTAGVVQKQLLSNEIASLAETSPRAAIVEAWLQLSSAALRALKKKGFPVPPGKEISPRFVEDSLGEANLLSKEQLKLLRQLRTTRNSAVHGSSFNVDAGAALTYVSVARQLSQYLER